MSAAKQPNLLMDIRNIEKDTVNNTDYRRVICTTDQTQLVLMSLDVGEDIPVEKHHNTTQFIRIEAGTGIATVDDEKYRLKPNISIIIPANSKHYIKQTGKHPLKLYTLYSPPEHPKNTKQSRQIKK